jgi:hypothetical protein
VIVITPLGHPEGRREGRGDLRRRHECKLHSQSVLVKRQSLVQGPSRAVDRAVLHRSGASISAVAAWWLDGEQLVEVEIDNRLQLFCGSGFGEVFRQTIEPGAVFILQRY